MKNLIYIIRETEGWRGFKEENSLCVKDRILDDVGNYQKERYLRINIMTKKGELRIMIK